MIERGKKYLQYAVNCLEVFLLIKRASVTPIILTASINSASVRRESLRVT